MSSAHSERLTSSFHFGCLLFLASWLWLGIPVLRNTSPEKGRLYLVPDLKEKAFCFWHFKHSVLCGSVLCSQYWADVCPPYCFVERFDHEWTLVFVQCFSCICWEDIFSPCFVTVCVTLTCRWTSMRSWSKSYFTGMSDPCPVSCMLFADVLLRVSAPVSVGDASLEFSCLSLSLVWVSG